MSDIATISLRVNTSELEKGTQELDKFGSAAGVAAKSADGLGSDIDEVHKRVAEFRKRLEESTISARNSGKAQDALAESFMKQIDSIKTAGDATERLASISASLRAARRAGNIDEQNYLSLISDISRKQSEAAKTEQATAAAREIFVKKLKDQVATQKLSREELLRYRATQLGVSSTAEIYIQTLEKSNTGTQKLGRTSAAASRNIRTLATQMSRLTLGGMGGTGASLLGNLGLLTGPVGAATAALTLLGKAYYQGQQEGTEFNKALALTGNYAGITSERLNGMAKSLSGAGITQAAAAAALTRVTSAGKFTANQLEMVASTALTMQRTFDVAVDQTVSNFERLKKEPYQAAVELDQQMHFLTASQLEQIRTLSEAGNNAQAAGIAMSAYASASREASSKIEEHLGWIEKGWRGAKETASEYLDIIRAIGRDNSIEDVRSRLNTLAQFSPVASLLSSQVDVLPQITNEEKYQRDSKVAKEKAAQNAEAIQKRQNTASVNLLREYENEYEKHTRTLKEIRNSYASDEAKATATERENARYAEVMKRNEKKKTGSTAKAITDDLATRELASSQQRLAALREQETSTSKLTSQEQQLVKFNQQMADLKEKRILTSDQKSLIAREGELRASLQLEVSAASIATAHQTATEALEAMNKYTIDIAQRNQQAADAHGKTTKEIEKQAQLRQLEITYLKQKDMITKAISKAEESGAAADEIARLRQELEALTAAWKEAEGKILEGEAKAAKNSMDWGAGIAKGTKEWTTSATDMYSNMQGAATFALDSISGSMTDLVTTGKADFKDMTTSILKYLSEIMVKMALANAMKSAFGGTSFGAIFGLSDGGYVPFANGGFVGPATAMQNGFAGGGFTGNGGKYQPKGVVHGGEFVFTKEATKALGINQLYGLMHAAEGRGYANGGVVGTAPMLGFSGSAGGAGNINVVTNVTLDQSQGAGDVSASNTADTARQLQSIITKTVIDRLKKEKSPGGILYKR
jgi:lambda family phage tail tape measure protein